MTTAPGTLHAAPGAMHAASGRLRHLGVLRFSGPDHLAFLQGQLSNDTQRLATGSPLLAAYSSAQGRVLAVLHLLPHSTGIIALLPRDVLLPTLERLRKFVLRAKVHIEDASEPFAVSGLHGTQALEAAGIPVPHADRGYAERDGVAVGRVGRTLDRYWVIGPAAQLAQHRLAGELEDAQLIERDWRLADIRAGLPQVYAPTREVFVAQMLNLDLIDGISFSKGCYTGQEIIARTQHLGRIKRRMFRLQLPPGDWSIGEALRLTDGRAGRLTELAAAGHGFESLAVLNLGLGLDAGAPEADSTPGAAVAAHELPLPYSLAARA
jgi:folate-binding protein YgfZ